MSEFISDIHQNALDVLRELYLSSQVVQLVISAQDRITRKIVDNGFCAIVQYVTDHAGE